MEKSSPGNKREKTRTHGQAVSTFFSDFVEVWKVRNIQKGTMSTFIYFVESSLLTVI